jgi:hypothetical protein
MLLRTQKLDRRHPARDRLGHPVRQIVTRRGAAARAHHGALNTKTRRRGISQ